MCWTCKSSAQEFLSSTPMEKTPQPNQLNYNKLSGDAAINSLLVFAWLNTTWAAWDICEMGFQFPLCDENHHQRRVWYDVYVSQPVVVSMERMFGVWGDGCTLTRKSPSFAIREGRGYPALTILSHDWCNHGNDDRWHTLMQLRVNWCICFVSLPVWP